MPEREPYGFLDAYLRYNRAREHLADVRRLVETFKADPQDIGAHLYTDVLEDLQKVRWVRQIPIPYEIPIRVGETLYNLRCALDYLVFALAWHDTGVEPTGEWARWLQFPIESDKKRFKRRRPTRLKGVSEPHVAMIREYQPYEGCVWTSVLADLNDSDKHRHLAVLVGSFDPESDTTRYVRITPEVKAVEERGLIYPLGSMDVEDYATFDVVLPDGSLVTETLEELESEVGALLLRFGREFQLRPV